MFACQWSIDVPYGKQREALVAMRAWGAEKMRSSNFRKSKNRIIVGFVGVSASHIVDEYLFESLDDFEKALADMGQPQFRSLSDALAPYIISGSQKWTIYRVAE